MNKRVTFSSNQVSVSPPDLLDIQLQSFQKLFQIDSVATNRKDEELYKIFRENFPILATKENYTLEFIDYTIADPVYTPSECLEKGLTYNVALKVKFRLICKEDEKTKVIIQSLFLGNLPYMTPQGSFIFNGKERVLVSQIHRSYGVFFSQTRHLTGGKILSGKIIPLRGSWIEFVVDIHKVMYVYIDRRKKFPATLILRALGYSTDKEIFSLFGLGEEIKITKNNLKAGKGRKLAARLLKNYVEEFVDQETGEVISIVRNEVLLERGTILDDQSIETILNSKQATITLHKKDEKDNIQTIIYNTLEKDITNSQKEASEEIYQQIRNISSPDDETVSEWINNYFSPKRILLGEVGRRSMNKKLDLNVSENIHGLTSKDIIGVIKYLLNLSSGKRNLDDIDSLINRVVKTGRGQLVDECSVAIARLKRIAGEKMSIMRGEDFSPIDIVNMRVLALAMNNYLAVHHLSQFMDQINPIGELSHKRRFTSIGKGGFASSNHVGYEARDVHPTHYGVICGIETPDGMRVGIVNACAIYTKVDEMGFLKTPYFKVTNGKLDLSGKTHYLTVGEVEDSLIAQYTSNVSEKGEFLSKKIKARKQGDFFFTTPDQVSWMDVSNAQTVSISAACIPFLEHNDANRALMASNMMRQAIPLERPEAPIVGTGLEHRVVKDSRVLPQAKYKGKVTYVDANKIIIKNPTAEQTYHLKRMLSTNQNTCINLKPLVSKGDYVEEGQILCEGYATKQGELAVGINAKVAYMSYKGLNYEDGIVISQEMADKLTSLHVYEFIVEAVDTKLGPEKLTADLPNLSEVQLENLDENGIISVGTKVKAGDILVGKVTPKNQIDLNPENVLLQAIFGEKAYNVKDTSLRVPISFDGTVIDTQLFTRHPRDKETMAQIAKQLTLLKKKTNRKLSELKEQTVEKLEQILLNQKTNPIYDTKNNIILEPRTLITKEILHKYIFNVQEENINLNVISIKHINFHNWLNNPEKSKEIKSTLEKYVKEYSSIISKYKKLKFNKEIGSDLPFDVLKRAKIRVAKLRKMKAGDKLAGRFGNKGIVTYVSPNEDMPRFENGEIVDIVASPLGVPSRMNPGQIYEANLGFAGQKTNKKYAVEVFSKLGPIIVEKELKEANLPEYGACTLYDGCTGEPFEGKITCGVTYMLKLNHLVDEKIHARSTGPYGDRISQPLARKKFDGGQKLGEMERATLSAHGAEYLARETFSVKSDDIIGRRRTYEAIVQGTNLPEPGESESFKVLQHEIKGLNISLKMERENTPDEILKK